MSARRLLLPARGAKDSVRNAHPRLFVKPDDRWEVNNVLSQHTELAEHLELALRRFAAATADAAGAAHRHAERDDGAVARFGW